MLAFRDTLTQEDQKSIEDLVAAAGVFNAEEIEVAGQLAAEALEKGEERSGYSFIFAEMNGRILGYTCYGRVCLTQHSYDLFWIVTSKDAQRQGLARQLLSQTEQRIKDAGGRQVYAETSGQDGYLPARKFYESTGFSLLATFPDFYKPGDPKLVYAKILKP